MQARGLCALRKGRGDAFELNRRRQKFRWNSSENPQTARPGATIKSLRGVGDSRERSPRGRALRTFRVRLGSNMQRLLFSRDTALKLASIGLVTLLAACGGGGDLNIDFRYTSETDQHYVFKHSSLKARISGLEGHAPKCSVVPPHGANTSLPDGLVLNPDTCDITGEPAEAGAFLPEIKLTVSGFSGSVLQSVSIHVDVPTFRYAAAEATLPWGELFEPEPPTWVGYSPSDGDVVAFSLREGGQLPRGLMIDPLTGALSGAVTDLTTSLANEQVKVRVTRSGKSFEQWAGVLIAFDLPKVEYPVIHAKVGQAYSVSPELSAILKAPPFTVTFATDPMFSGNCGDLEPAVDAETGTVSATPSREISWGCLVSIVWTISDGTNVLSRPAQTLLFVNN